MHTDHVLRAVVAPTPPHHHAFHHHAAAVPVTVAAAAVAHVVSADPAHAPYAAAAATSRLWRISSDAVCVGTSV